MTSSLAHFLPHRFQFRSINSIRSHCPLCPPLLLQAVPLRFSPGSWGFAGWPEWCTAAVWNTPSALLWSARRRCHPVEEEEDSMESAERQETTRGTMWHLSHWMNKHLGLVINVNVHHQHHFNLTRVEVKDGGSLTLSPPSLLNQHSNIIQSSLKEKLKSKKCQQCYTVTDLRSVLNKDKKEERCLTPEQLLNISSSSSSFILFPAFHWRTRK